LLRVLHLTDTWGPGGAETIYADLAAGIGPPRFESLAGLPRASDWLYDTVRARGVRSVILPNSGAFDLAHVTRVVSVIRKHKIDLLQAHTLGSSVYASFAGFLCRIPVVCTLHGRVDLGLNERHRYARFSILRLGRTFVIPVSVALQRELLESTPINPVRTRVIYNGVNTNHFRPGDASALRRELGVLPDEMLIGAVGNVRRVKGYEVLLDAAARLKTLNLPFKVIVVGQATGEVFEEIASQRSTLGLEDHVIFAGFQSDPSDFYRAFDVYALTSHSEGFPLSTLQALATGLPIVATRCGGPEEMLAHGTTGLLADVGSGAQVSEHLATLLTAPRLRVRMGVAARAVAERQYSTASMLEQYAALYQTLVKTTRRA
jgi:glycosyltransferase involved in cell wall biosynthesis